MDQPLFFDFRLHIDFRFHRTDSIEEKAKEEQTAHDFDCRNSLGDTVGRSVVTESQGCDGHYAVVQPGTEIGAGTIGNAELAVGKSPIDQSEDRYETDVESNPDYGTNI